jgi:hypothetical protein
MLSSTDKELLDFAQPCLSLSSEWMLASHVKDTLGQEESQCRRLCRRKDGSGRDCQQDPRSGILDGMACAKGASGTDATELSTKKNAYRGAVHRWDAVARLQPPKIFSFEMLSNSSGEKEWACTGVCVIHPFCFAPLIHLHPIPKLNRQIEILLTSIIR